MGVWIFTSSVAGLRSGGLPKGISWFGVVAALLSFSVATGYITKIEWLGETSLGALAFLAVPAWLIWLGIVFHLHYVVSGHDLDPKKVERAITLSQGRYCSVAATIRGVTEITYSFEVRAER